MYQAKMTLPQMDAFGQYTVTGVVQITGPDTFATWAGWTGSRRDAFEWLRMNGFGGWRELSSSTDQVLYYELTLPA